MLAAAFGHESIRPSRLVRAEQRGRRRGDALFARGLFADPAWDMLLELSATFLEHRRVSVSGLSVAAHVPPTTALRWMARLEQDGFAVRRDDPHGGRRSWVELTEAGVNRMRR